MNSRPEKNLIDVVISKAGSSYTNSEDSPDTAMPRIVLGPRELKLQIPSSFKTSNKDLI